MISLVPASSEEGNSSGPPVILNRVVREGIVHTIRRTKSIARPHSKPIVAIIAHVAVAYGRIAGTL
ncbi:hypothetical protein D3C81_2068840 [compost metagenome]